MHSAIIFLDIYPRDMKTYYPHKNLYVNVHSGIIHNIPKVETVNVHKMMNGWTKYGIPTQQNII